MHAFGIDVKLIITQIINFVVLAGLLTYFLYKPVLKILAEREEKIKQGIKDAENAALANAEAQEEKQKILQKAQLEAQEIDLRAKSYGKEKEEELLAKAQEAAALVVKDAEAKSELLKAQALKDSEAEISKIAILAAEKILSEKNS